LKKNGNRHSAPLVVIHFAELGVFVVAVVVVVVVCTTIPIVVVVDSAVVVVNGVVVVVVVGAAVVVVVGVVGGLLHVCATADSLVLLQSSPEQHLPTRLLQKAPSVRQVVYWQ